MSNPRNLSGRSSHRVAASALGRETLYSAEARFKVLPRLPSLEKSPPSGPGAEAPLTAAEPSGPAPLQEPAPSFYLDRGQPIPAEYGTDRLASLVRDPFWLFLYWELSGGMLERLRFQHSTETMENARWVLRLQSPLQDSPAVVDINVRAGAWYVKVRPDTTYVVELGFVAPQGEFVSVVRGNEVRTPRAGIAPIVDERWSIARAELEKLSEVSGFPAAPEEWLPIVAGQKGGTLQRLERPRARSFFAGYPVSPLPERNEPERTDLNPAASGGN